VTAKGRTSSAHTCIISSSSLSTPKRNNGSSADGGEDDDEMGLEAAATTLAPKSVARHRRHQGARPPLDAAVTLRTSGEHPKHVRPVE
jgi:hypothetical protein